MKILFITDTLPYPPISGDLIRTYNLVRRVARAHEVWLFSVRNPVGPSAILHMEQFCRHVETVDIPRQDPVSHVPGLLRYALTGKPLELKFFESEAQMRRIGELTKQEGFDIVQIEQSHMALYRECLGRANPAKQVLGFHNIAFDQYGQLARVEKQRSQRFRAWLYSLQMRSWEPRYAEQFDRCTVVSDLDRRLLLRANTRLRVDVIPNGVDTSRFQFLPPSTSAPAILFVGSMDYAPVQHGAAYFVKAILPRIREKIPGIQLWLVGKDPTPDILDLDGKYIHVTGRVDDILPYYERCAVCVVPLQAGGGTRLKILEAMALGRPVVSTSKGCEGLDVVNGVHLLVADDPVAFAEGVLCLLNNRALYQKVTAEARALVTERYDWEAIATDLVSLYSKLVG